MVSCTKSDDKSTAKETPKSAAPAEEKVENKTGEKGDPDEADLEPGEAQDVLVGIWRMDLERLQDAPEIRALPKEEREAAVSNAKRLMSSLAFEFAPDGKMKMFMGSQVKEGSFRVLKTEGNILHLETKTGRAPDLLVEKIQVVVGNDTLRIDNAPEQEGKKDFVYLQRGAPGPPEVLEAEALEETPQ